MPNLWIFSRRNARCSRAGTRKVRRRSSQAVGLIVVRHEAAARRTPDGTRRSGATRP